MIFYEKDLDGDYDVIVTLEIADTQSGFPELNGDGGHFKHKIKYRNLKFCRPLYGWL
jgi:hypothetical protein